MSDATLSLPMDRFDGVVFDMDGVLCDSEPLICEAAIRLFAERYATTVRAEDFAPFVGTGENRYLGGVAERYGLALEIESDKRRLYEIYLEIIPGRLAPVAGAKAFVDACQRRGLKLAIATSADEVKMLGNLRQIGLPRATFDACVHGLEVARKKPDPEIFLLAVARLGLAPAQCLVVEDAPSGIQAGKAAGASCLGLSTTFDPAQLRAAGADWTAPDFRTVAI